MATVDYLNLTESATGDGLGTEELREGRFVSLARRVPAGSWRYLLVLSDALLIFAAFLTAYLLRYQAQLFISVDPAFLTNIAVKAAGLE